MTETFHQLPLAALPSRDRRFRLGPACLAFLLLLLAAGLGLLARTVFPNTPLTGTEEDGTRAAKEYLSQSAVATPSASLQEILVHPDVIPSHRHALLGQQAPEFELADAEGTVWNLRELRDGCPVVLIFYYGAHCISCMRHLVEVNRDLPLFRAVGARVVAISADPPEVTRQRCQQHEAFGFTVLSDPGNKVAQVYRACKEAQDGQTADFLRHGTFLLDGNGKIQWVNIGDAPFRHNPALVYQLARMEGRLPSIQAGP